MLFCLFKNVPMHAMLAATFNVLTKFVKGLRTIKTSSHWRSGWLCTVRDGFRVPRPCADAAEGVPSLPARVAVLRGGTPAPPALFRFPPALVGVPWAAFRLQTPCRPHAGSSVASLSPRPLPASTSSRGPRRVSLPGRPRHPPAPRWRDLTVAGGRLPRDSGHPDPREPPREGNIRISLVLQKRLRREGV